MDDIDDDDKYSEEDKSDQRSVEEEVVKKIEEIEFPDTDVKIEFGRSGSVEIKTRTASTCEEPVTITKPMASKKKGGKIKLPKKPEVVEKKVEEKKNSNEQNIRGKKG